MIVNQITSMSFNTVSGKQAARKSPVTTASSFQANDSISFGNKKKTAIGTLIAALIASTTVGISANAAQTNSVDKNNLQKLEAESLTFDIPTMPPTSDDTWDVCDCGTQNLDDSTMPPISNDTWDACDCGTQNLSYPIVNDDIAEFGVMADNPDLILPDFNIINEDDSVSIKILKYEANAKIYNKQADFFAQKAKEVEALIETEKARYADMSASSLEDGYSGNTKAYNSEGSNICKIYEIQMQQYLDYESSFRAAANEAMTLAEVARLSELAE